MKKSKLKWDGGRDSAQRSKNYKQKKRALDSNTFSSDKLKGGAKNLTRQAEDLVLK